MINEILYLNGYGIYIWSAYIFTLISFSILHYSIKRRFEKEREIFRKKFGLLDNEKKQAAYRQETNRKLLA